MSINKHKTASKIASVLVSITTVGWLSGAAMLAPVAVHAQTDTAALIATLQAQIAALQAQLNALAAPAPVVGAKCSFTRSLTVGSRGDDVTCLQNYLTGTGHYTYSGGATGYFGNVTKNAVAAWQAASGVSPAVGYFGSLSQAKYNSLVATAPAPTTPGVPAPTTPAPTTPGVPAPTGTLRVDAGIHPAASLFPLDSTRVPFTVLKFTAPAGQNVTVNSLLVERTGLASNLAFDGVILLDENGVQVGVAKTLNSVNQANLTEPFVVTGGTTRTMTLAGNAQVDANTLGGQIAYLTLVSVSSSAASVVGTFPITGTGHTVNETLTIGSVTLARGSLDPGSSQTKEVGTKDYTFSSIRVTAGSAEKVYLRTMKWNQTGSINASDLKNVKTYVEGVAYDAVVSSDGKYFTSTFSDNNGRGILTDKGFSKEISIKGDVEGGSGRTVDFDIAKRTDIGLFGETYGYGITSPATGTSDPTDDTAAFSSVEDPWYDAAQVTSSNGTIDVQVSTTVAAQNIPVNQPDVPFGAILVTIKGEPISVSRIGFNVSFDAQTATQDINDLTNVTLVHSNGTVIAGPVDGSATDDHAQVAGVAHGAIVFTDSVTFPVGENVYIVKGKVGTDIANSRTLRASTTPSTDFATVRGTVTGNTITPTPSSVISLSTMTVRTASLTISVSPIPIAQTVIAGSQRFLFANYILDATASGEDLRLTSLPADYVAAGGASASDLTNCQVYDGTTSITSNNPKNPTANSSSTSFIFNGNGLTLPKGTTKTVGLKCNVASGVQASERFTFGIGASEDDNYTGATGLVSGQTVTEVFTGAAGQIMTVAANGSLTVALDTGAPALALVAPGQNVELARIRFDATNEDIDLKVAAFNLTDTSSNTPDNLVGRQITLHTTDGTQIGTAVFPTEDYATSSTFADGVFRVARGNFKVLVVKGVIAGITSVGPMTTSGDILKVDYDGAAVGVSGGTYGVGIASGQNIAPTSGADTAVAGVRLFRSYPTLAKLPLGSDKLTNGDIRVLRWSITANAAGDVAIHKFTIRVSTTTVTATNLNVFGYTDTAFSLPVTGVTTGGQLASSNRNPGIWDPADAQDLEIFVESAAAASSTIQIPAGATRYFEARVSITGSATGASIATRLMGDSVLFTDTSVANKMMAIASTVNTFTSGSGNSDNFIWGANSTTSISQTATDFTNGFSVAGLPATGLNPETLSF